jgi:hypothetical protein
VKLLLYWVLTLLGWLLSTWRNLQDRWRAWRSNSVPLASSLLVHSIRVGEHEAMDGPCSGALFSELTFGADLGLRIAAGERLEVEFENLSDQVLRFVGCAVLRHREGGRSVLPFRQCLIHPHGRFTATASPAVGGTLSKIMIPTLTIKVVGP